MATSGIEVGHAFVAISASGKGAAQQVQRDFNRTMPAVGKQAGGHLGAGIFAAAAKFAAPLAALFAVGKLITFGKSSVGEAREAQKVGALTNQVIKTTGSAAKVTAKQVGALATAISNKTGVDDEAIQANANLLLTFTSVRNEVGKGNDIFNQATAVVSDMAVAFKESGKAASIQLGKALNDPIKGMTALARVGVQFTDQQKKQITTLVKSGDVLGAQKIILAELRKETGGAAAASATAGEKLATVWANFKEQVGTAILPTLDKLEIWLAKKIIPAMSRFVTEAGPALKTIVGGFRAFAVSFRVADGDITSSGFAGFMERLGFVASQIIPVFHKIGPALTPVWTILKNMLAQLRPLQPQFEALARVVGGALLKALPVVGQAFAAIGRALGIGLVTVIPKIAAGFVQLGSSGGFIRAQFLPALKGIIDAGQKLGAVVVPIIKQLAAEFLKRWPQIKPIVVEIFKTIGGIVLDVMAGIQHQIRSVTTVIAFIWGKWGKQITALTGSHFTSVLRQISAVMKIIGGIIKVVTGLMTGDWRKAGQGIKQIADGLKTYLVAKFGDIAGKLKANIKALMDNLRAKFKSGVAAIGAAWDGLQAVAKKPISFVINTVLNNGLIAAFNKIAGAIGVAKLPRISVPGFAAGGWTGPGSKMQPAGVVHADEFVINKASRRRIESQAPGLLDSLNGYASGGLVGGSGRFTARFAAVLSAAQKLFGGQFSIYQRGFRPATSYSGTSHAGDAVDLGPVTAHVVRILRSLGIAAWRRGPAQGFSLRHIHGVPLPGRGSAGGSGVWQAQDYLKGGDGLGGRDYEARGGGGVLGKIGAFIKAGFSSFIGWFKNLIKDPLAKLSQIGSSPFAQLAGGAARMISEGMVKKVTAFDSGGYLQPGYTLAYNGTGRAERVVGPGGHGGGITVHQHFPSSSSPQAAAAAANGRLVAALSARGF